MLFRSVKSKVITPRSSALDSGSLGIASPILPRLYLSGYAVASNEVRITALGVTHVLSVMQLVAPEYEGAIKTMLVDIEDTAQSDLLQHLDATTAFIKDALEENDTNVVLVHCVMGVSRSAAVVCAYLVATTSMTPQEALAFVMERRPVVCPNLGFRKQLETYSKRFLPPPPKKSITNTIQFRMRQLKEHANLRGRRPVSEAGKEDS